MAAAAAAVAVMILDAAEFLPAAYYGLDRRWQCQDAAAGTAGREAGGGADAPLKAV